MSQANILITGCSSGIGYATAHYLRERGWRVFASCRKAEDCQRLAAEGFESPLIDYADDATIRQGLDEVLNATNGRIDAVFNNGAFATPMFAEDLSRGALREIFETNLFGVHELTRRVLPVMRAQGHGRIIQCSSVLGFVGLRARSAYVATKFALEGLTDVTRLENAGFPVDLILIEPGPITSLIRQNAQANFEKWCDWQNSPHRRYYEKAFIPRLYDTSEKKDAFELPAEAVAAKVLKALTAKRPKRRYYVTTITYIMAIARRILPASLLDKLLLRT